MSGGTGQRSEDGGKAKGLPADPVFPNIEDTVAPLVKANARKNIMAALNEGRHEGKVRFVPVNDPI